MSLLVGVGWSQNADSKVAAEEAYRTATAPLEGNAPSFLMLFASPHDFDQEVLIKTLSKQSPSTQLIGCSTAGEITSDGSRDQSIALMAIYSNTIEFTTGVSSEIADDSKQAGRDIANAIKNSAGEKPSTALMLPDGLSGNGADIVRGVLEVFGDSFMLAGGSAGDNYKFEKTFQYLNSTVHSGNVVGVGMHGDVHFGIGVRHGWLPISIAKIVTKAVGNVVYEIDGVPAIRFYDEYFGDKRKVIDSDHPLAQLAVTYPLGIPSPNKDGYLIRDPLSVDENGAITCAAEIPEGAEVYLMMGSSDEAIAAAKDAARIAKKQVEGRDIKAVILFNCIARKRVLMQRKSEEIEAIREIIGTNVPLIGFYTYGEQAPLGGDEIAACSFHNETDVVFVLAE